MSIIYGLIAKNDDQVLCEYTEYKGNFEQISRMILRKIQKNSRRALIYDESYNFTYINVLHIKDAPRKRKIQHLFN